MSYKENNKKDLINLNNYEEYFLLYVDGELNEQEMKEVDAFVNNHQDLKAELDVLLSTKLTPDAVTLNKDELYSLSMDKLINEEELLSCIDNELSNDEKRKIEEKINTSSIFQLEYESLLKAKLDPTEIIAYPNKEELYKRKRRVIPFSPLLRAAAVFILIAAGFIIYEKRKDNSNGIQPSIAIGNQTSNPDSKRQTIVPVENNKPTIAPENVVKGDEPIAFVPDYTPNKKGQQKNTITNSSKKNSNESMAKNDIPDKIDIPVHNPDKSKIERSASTPLIAYVPANETINKSPVTSALSPRTNSSSVPTPAPDHLVSVAARSDRKGSFKSLLRKAARVIEKKTGIDPANDNDELLIGAVAVKIN